MFLLDLNYVSFRFELCCLLDLKDLKVDAETLSSIVQLLLWVSGCEQNLVHLQRQTSPANQGDHLWPGSTKFQQILCVKI